MYGVGSTKDKILTTALELFSTKGYATTSIREIARLANVNLSAINYYFDSKQGLYAAVILESKSVLKSHVHDLYISRQTWDVGDFVGALIDLFYEYRVHITATFKVILTNVEIKTHDIFSEDKLEAPPGAEYLIDIIRKNKNIINEEVIYNISVITIGYIIHNTVCMDSFEEKCSDLAKMKMSREQCRKRSMFLIDKLVS